jgi:hypothetical protein
MLYHIHLYGLTATNNLALLTQVTASTTDPWQAFAVVHFSDGGIYVNQLASSPGNPSDTPVPEITVTIDNTDAPLSHVWLCPQHKVKLEACTEVELMHTRTSTPGRSSGGDAVAATLPISTAPFSGSPAAAKRCC